MAATSSPKRVRHQGPSAESVTSISTSVVVRTDASMRLGMGHVARCLNLADALARNGAHVAFVTNPLPAGAAQRIQDAGFQHLTLPANDDAHSQTSPWPKPAQIADAAATAELVGRSTDLTIVDHYGLDAAWEEAASSMTRKLVAVDDLADRKHCAAALLDHNWSGAGTAGRYERLTEPGATLLIGPRYALLDRAYAARHWASFERHREPLRTLIISFGGSDPCGETEKVLTALGTIDTEGLAIHVVMGAAMKERRSHLELAARGTSVAFHDALPTLAPLFATADLAIGAGGITTWERICMGVPSLVTTVASNQVPVTKALHEAGAVMWLGDSGNTDPETYRRQIAAALEGEIPKPPPLVDGHGAARAALAILGAAAPPRLRPATVDDTAVFVGSDTGTCSWRDHYLEGPDVWQVEMARFEADLDASDRMPVVVSSDETPVGAARLSRMADRAHAELDLDVAVHTPQFEAQVIELLNSTLWDPTARRLQPASRTGNEGLLSIDVA